MKPTHQAPTAFADDLEYLEANLEFIRARCDRLRAAREHTENHARRSPSLVLVGDAGVSDCPVFRRAVGPLQAREDQFRERLDARLEANRANGPALSLDETVARHGLDDLERTVLLLAMLPVLGQDYAEILDPLVGWGHGLTVDAVARFNELDLAERVELATRFQAGSKLVEASLITVDLRADHRPADVPSSSVSLTPAGVAAVVGSLSASTTTSTTA